MKRRKIPRILKFDHPALSTICKPVTDFTNPQVSKTISDMLYCLHRKINGVGLAANQIGSNLQIIILKKHYCFRPMVNPVIVNKSIDTNTKSEGCLSYPKISKQIERYDWIDVRWNNGQGKEFTERFEFQEARIIQHEIDHLNGKCKLSEQEL